MLAGLITTVTFVVLGAHVAAPWRLRRADSAARLSWSRSALPLLLLALIANLLLLKAQPSSMFEATAAGDGLATASLRVAGLLLGSLAIHDTLLLLHGSRVEALGWKIGAGLGLVAVLGFSFVAEISRFLPTTPGLGHLVTTTLSRAAVVLAAGELLKPGRPSWQAPLAGGAVILYAALLPSEIRTVLYDGGGALTAAAATILFVSSRWLPPSLRRAATLGATLVAGMFFADVEFLQRLLPVLPMSEIDVAQRLAALVSFVSA